MSSIALRIAFLSGVFCISANAQFDSLETTDDGNVLLFQSTWLDGSIDSASSRIFHWDTSGFKQASQSTTAQTPNQSYNINPFLSGDGKIFGYSFVPGCSSTGCAAVAPTLFLNGAAAPSGLPSSGSATISRNGRYLASGNVIADLSSGTTQTIANGFMIGGRFGISNNGGLLLEIVHSAFVVSTTDLMLSTKPGVVIVTAPIVLNAVVSAAESLVVYEIWGDTAAVRDQLWSYNVASGQATKIADIPLGTSLGISQFQPAISNDGSRLLYRRPRTGGGLEVVLLDINTNTATVVSQVLPSASNFVISGDGKSAWVHRVDGKLVRIALDTMQTTEVPGRHAWMSQQAGAAVPGSYRHLYGGGFAPDDASGSATGITVSLAAAPLPILWATTRELDVQIPWLGPQPGQYLLTLQSASSPFVSVLPMDMQAFAPTFERTGIPTDSQRGLIIAHQDFHGVVTTSDPATPGENIHAYMTGLGGVQPLPPTGSPPVGLANVSERPVCWVAAPLKTPEPAPVMFAGLAPGMVGIYQVDISLPGDLSAGNPMLSCVVEVPGYGVAGDFGSLPVGSPTRN